MFSRISFSLLSIIFLTLHTLYAEKIKDISNIVGVRENQLIGYGLVVGLNGTGDGTTSTFTLQSLANMLQTVNVKVDAAAIQSDNVAAVMITANLPAFARQGDSIDVLVSSIGDADSLEGGTLLMTPLVGVDGKTYAVAQGAISVGGRSSGAGGGGGGNHKLAASMIGGAVVENEVSYDLYSKKNATLSLKQSNFANAVATQNTINKFYGESVATAVDPRTIKLKKPENISMVEFLAEVQEVKIGYTRENKIVIDERTGTVVAGINITVEPVVITHGEITIKIDSAPKESANQNAGTDMGGVSVSADSNQILTEEEVPTVANVARALQKLGAGPQQIIAILSAMKKAGAITVELDII